MTARRFVQLLCEGCGAVYPLSPVAGQGARELRSRAATAGWEVMRHTKGRDICPPCRVREINEAVDRAETGG